MLSAATWTEACSSTATTCSTSFRFNLPSSMQRCTVTFAPFTPCVLPSWRVTCRVLVPETIANRFVSFETIATSCCERCDGELRSMSPQNYSSKILSTPPSLARGRADAQSHPFITPANYLGLQLSAPPLAEGAEQQQQHEEETAQDSSAREAEKEASKAQRMLSLAGIRVAPVPQDAASSTSNSVAQQPPSSASSLLLNPNVAFPSKRRSRGGGGAAPKGPPRFSVLRFLATTGEGVTQGAAPGDVPQESEDVAAVSYGRGDLVEFTVVARRGQRQQSQRVGDVSLLRKAGLPCR